MKWRRYTVNEQFFDMWTKDSAYVLGWILGDGHVCSRLVPSLGRVRKCLHIYGELGEEPLIRQMLTAMGSNHPSPVKKNSRVVQVQIGSARLVDRLVALRVKDHRVPDVAPFERHLVRGLFDSDGCVSKSKPQHLSGRFILSSVSLEMLEGVAVILNAVGVSTSLYLGEKKQLAVNSKMFAPMYQYLYGDGGMRLERKYQKATEILWGISSAGRAQGWQS